jgi:hypothetical protein
VIGMKIPSSFISHGSVLGLCLALAACGGGGGGSTGPAVSVQKVNFTVISAGPIAGAKVCLDVDQNGDCTGEIYGNTDAYGQVTLTVPSDQVGKYPALAIVYENNTAIGNPIRYLLTAPADSAQKSSTAPTTISPLSTMVQHLIASGQTRDNAVRLVQGKTGVSVNNLLNNYVSPTSDINAQVLARAVTLLAGQAWKNVSDLTTPPNGVTKYADLDKVIRSGIFQNFPDIVTSVSGLAKADPCKSGPASQNCDLKIIANLGANKVSSGVTADNAVAAVNANNAKPVPVAGYGAPVDTTKAPIDFSLKWLRYSGPGNWYFRGYLSDPNYTTNITNYTMKYPNNLTPAQKLNAEGTGQYYRYIANASGANGTVVTGGLGVDENPSWQNVWYWSNINNSWQRCDKTTENYISPLDAATGLHSFDWCEGYQQGTMTVSEVDLAGQTLLDMVNGIRNYGAPAFFDYANWGGAGVIGALNGDKNYQFVAGDGAKLRYSNVTTTAYAPQYNTADANSDLVKRVSDETLAQGGGPFTDANAPCNLVNHVGVSEARKTPVSLDDLVSHNKATPCNYTEDKYKGLNGVWLSSNDGNSYNGTPNTGRNEWWGQSTLLLGSTLPAGLNAVAQASAPSFYTGYYSYRVGFPTTNTPREVYFYACLQRYDDLTSSNCDRIGTDTTYTYTRTTYGSGASGGEVLRFSGFPAELAYLYSEPVYIARDNIVYPGYIFKPWQYSDVRPNYVASKKLMDALSIPFPPKQQ